jgi:hypothetical protein
MGRNMVKPEQASKVLDGYCLANEYRGVGPLSSA